MGYTVVNIMKAHFPFQSGSWLVNWISVWFIIKSDNTSKMVLRFVALVPAVSAVRISDICIRQSCSVISMRKECILSVTSIFSIHTGYTAHITDSNNELDLP